MLVYSRLSFALRTFASALAKTAFEESISQFLVSRSSFATTSAAYNSFARSRLVLASSTRALASASSASAEANAASYGRGSITKRRSPFFTFSPSLKFMDFKYPPICALILTLAMASIFRSVVVPQDDIPHDRLRENDFRSRFSGGSIGLLAASA